MLFDHHFPQRYNLTPPSQKCLVALDKALIVYGTSQSQAVAAMNRSPQKGLCPILQMRGRAEYKQLKLLTI